MMRLLSCLYGAWGCLWAACLAAILAGGATGYLVHRMDQATVAALRLADQEAETKAIGRAAAVQHSQDQANLDAALAEARAQARIVTVTHTIVREIPVHVPQARRRTEAQSLPCIPYGLVRVLDDAATGSDGANAPAPAGESDDACAPLSWRAFAGELTDDYGIGRQNAEQLNALEADVRALAAAANARLSEKGDK